MWFDIPLPVSDTTQINDDLAALYVGPESPVSNPYQYLAQSAESRFENFKAWLTRQPDLLRYMRQRLTGRPITGLGLSADDLELVWLYADIAAGKWDRHILAEPTFVFEAGGAHLAPSALIAQKFYGSDPQTICGCSGHGYALPTGVFGRASDLLAPTRKDLDGFFAHANANPDIEYRFPSWTNSDSNSHVNSIEMYCIKEAPPNVILPGTWLHRADLCRPRLVVAGSKSLTRYQLVEDKLDALTCRLKDPVIVTTGTRGTAQLAERYAMERDLELVRMPTYWHRLDGTAAALANARMCSFASHVIAFWDGSPGRTQGLLDETVVHSLPVRLVRI